MTGPTLRVAVELASPMDRPDRLIPRLVSELVASPEVAKVFVAIGRHADGLVAAGRPQVARWEGEDVEAVIVVGGTHSEEVRRHLSVGRRVISTSAQPEVLALLGDAPGSVAAVGAAPGLSSLLVVHAAALLDSVEEVRVFVADDTAGPFSSRGAPWSASGELVWFPDPVGARDVVPTSSPEEALIRARFGAEVRVICGRAVHRASIRPWMSRRHAVGAVLVEVRGERHGDQLSVTYAVIDDLPMLMGTVAAVCAVKLPADTTAATLLDVDPLPLLRELARRGVKVATPSSLRSAPTETA